MGYYMYAKTKTQYAFYKIQCDIMYWSRKSDYLNDNDKIIYYKLIRLFWDKDDENKTEMYLLAQRNALCELFANGRPFLLPIYTIALFKARKKKSGSCIVKTMNDSIILDRNANIVERKKKLMELVLA